MDLLLMQHSPEGCSDESLAGSLTGEAASKRCGAPSKGPCSSALAQIQAEAFEEKPVGRYRRSRDGILCWDLGECL